MGRSTESDVVPFVAEVLLTQKLINMINEGDEFSGWKGQDGCHMLGKSKCLYSTVFDKEVHSVAIFTEDDESDYCYICGLDESAEAYTSVEKFLADFNLSSDIKIDISVHQTL